MQKESETIDWQSVEDSLIKEWYFVSKIMSQIIPKTFPYFTFKGLTEAIKDDPNFNKPDGDK